MDNELLVSEIQKKVGVTDFVSEIKSVENYPILKNWHTYFRTAFKVCSLNYR